MSWTDQREPEIARALARELEAVYVRTPDVPLDALLEAYGDVERRFVQRLAHAPELALEARRRVAELSLYATIDKAAPFLVVRERLDRVERLGYADLERRATIGIIFARACMEMGRPDEARAVLRPLARDLDERLARDEDDPLYVRLRDTLQPLLRELQSPEGPP